MVDESGPWLKSQLEDINININDSTASFDDFFAEELKRFNLDEAQRKVLNFLAVMNRPIFFSDDAMYSLVSKHKVLIEHDGLVEFANKAFAEFVYKNISNEERRKLHDEASKLPEQTSDELKWHEACGQKEFLNIVKMLTALAKDYARTGDNKNAVNCFQKILDLSDEYSPDILLVAKIEHDLVLALFEAGQFEKADTKSRTLIEKLSQENPTPQIQELLWGANDICLRVAMQNRDLVETEKRIQFVRDRLGDFIQEPQNSAKRVFFENRQAQLCVMKGEHGKAEEIFIRTEKDFPAVANNDLDEVLFLRKNYEAAKKVCQTRLTMSSASFQKGRYYFRLSKIYLNLGDTQEAIANLNKCVDIAKEHQDFASLFRAYTELGHILFNYRSGFDQAKDYWERALFLAQKNKDAASCGGIASNLGRYFNRVQSYQHAFHFLIYAIRTIESLPVKSQMSWGQLASAKLELAETCLHTSELNLAESSIRDCEKIVTEHGLAYLVFWVYCQYVCYYQSKKDTVMAKDYFDKAKSIAKSPQELAVLEGLNV